jgi:hypothetical protein
MTDAPNTADAARLLHDLQHQAELRHQPVNGTGLEPQLAMLRAWQSERLARTYADLLADRHYRPACLFFLSDIYAPRDFSQRDHDFERIHAFLSRVVPPPMLQVLTDAIELNALTNKLDNLLLRVLVDDLGVTDTIRSHLYVEGYRRCDNYAERVHQIDLITRLAAQVAEAAHFFGVSVALTIIRGPAHRAGWIEVCDFLERGYDAFRQMRDVKSFVNTIERREKDILEQIFSGNPDPFAT